MIERELKLALPGRFEIPALELGGEAIETVSLPDLTLRATYYDTADLRLARHGVTLRYRTGEERGAVWTLKLPLSVRGATVERNELHFISARREPPAQARTLVTAFARRQPLVAVASLRTRRRQRRLLRDGMPFAELADDEVSVVENRRVVSRFRELEIEALADDADLDDLADQLRRAGATDAEPIPKVVRALGSRATAPADISAVPLPADPTMADALVSSLADALVRLVRHDPLARLGNPEGVHQVRVALRRLRSDLKTLGEAVDDGWRSRMQPRLRDAAGALGAARDLDVLDAALRGEVGSVDRVLAPLFDHIEVARAGARTQLEAVLDAPEYVAVLDALVDAVASPPVGPRAEEMAGDALPALVIAAWRRLERRAEELEPDSPDGAFHDVRIAAKRTRYAAELAARVLPGKAAAGAASLAEQVAKVQDGLGRAQDAAVAEATIRGTLDRPRVSKRYAFEAGRLAERARARGTTARGEFFDTWETARRRRWRRWAM